MFEIMWALTTIAAAVAGFVLDSAELVLLGIVMGAVQAWDRMA